MKKIVSIIITLILCLALMLPITVSAASASANLTGPGTIRAGDTITLSFNLNGSGIFGASGTLSYDNNQVTLTGTTQKIGSPWAVEFNGNSFVAYDNNLSNPINSNKTLFTVTFKIKSVAAGTNIKISCTGVTASDGSADKNVGTVTYSKSVSAPLSTDNNLANLTVSNATISPAFSAKTTSYTASVPFEVSKLKLSATAADPKAKVSINDPNLTPGGTTKISVTVTAENGSKKTYAISVKRAQDPNYKPDDNNRLVKLTVEGFLLSPVFDPETTEYVVWAPFETESVKIDGAAANGKASVETIGGEKLTAGQDNPVKVICTAENGDKREYTVTVKRAAAHETVEGIPDKPATDSFSGNSPTTPDNDAKTKDGIAPWWLLVVGLGSIILGAVMTLLIQKLRKQ